MADQAEGVYVYTKALAPSSSVITPCIQGWDGLVDTKIKTTKINSEGLLRLFYEI